MNKNKKIQWNLAWLKSTSVMFIWKVLSSKGAKVYFVGGCVRDSIQGREIKDIDIATDALPSEVVELAQAVGLKVIKTGFSYGSVSIIIKKDCFEVTTFRSDLVTDGRHAKVGFSSNILDDARRRDFTMNAIYMTIDGQIVDPIFGLDDVLNGRVRFIGNPKKRIHEDYLRVLRYFRFRTIYEEKVDSIDHSMIKTFSDAIHGIKMLSHDRVWGELSRILLADNPYLSLKIMDACGILQEILPLASIEDLHRLLRIEHEFKLEFKEINRLVVLNVICVKSWVKKFPLKKQQKRWLNKLLLICKDPSTLRVKGYKYKTNLVIAAVAVLKANSGAKLHKNEVAEIKDGSTRKFPVGMSDFVGLFLPSRELGDELKRLKDVWFASNLELSRNELIADLRKNYHKTHLQS